MKYEYVLFDLDGTLMDTGDGILDCMRATIIEVGLTPGSDEVVATFIGPPIAHSFERIFGVDSETAIKYSTIFREKYKEEYLFIATIYDGMLDLIKLLHENGVKIGVATYKREDCAIKLLDGVGIGEFCTVIHGSDYNNTLSKQQIMELCMEKNTCSLDKVLMVGDTLHDGGAAKSMGVDFLAVTYGFGFKKGEMQEVSEFTPVFVADTVPEITKYLGL